MKKILAIALCLLLVAGLAACASSNKNAEAPVLTMATEGTFQPYEYYDGDKLIGIDVEIAEAIAEKLGCREGRVHTSLCRSRKKLRDYLIKEELL